MTARVAVLNDVAVAATALSRREGPQEGAGRRDRGRRPGDERAGARGHDIDALRAIGPTAPRSSSNTDVAVADFDHAAAFPWFTDGVPDAHRAAAE